MMPPTSNARRRDADEQTDLLVARRGADEKAGLQILRRRAGRGRGHAHDAADRQREHAILDAHPARGEEHQRREQQRRHRHARDRDWPTSRSVR